MSDSEPLFQNTDEQERMYAPQQVPGSNLPPEEQDSGGSAARGTALADDRGAAGDEGNAGIAGADGDPGTMPVIPVRPDISVTTPVAVPAATDREPGE